MDNYDTLVRILDQTRKEAPPVYKKYYPIAGDEEKLNQARSRAFIHLYLKVRFGMLDFVEREKHVTDDVDDGGVDGYYIDKENRDVFLIQSKFRTNEYNFKEKEIEIKEVLKMESERIIKGETCYEGGNKYNGKIQRLIKEIQSIPDVSLWDYKVIILANLSNITKAQLKKLVGGIPAEIWDFNKCYRELVFTVVTGTYYRASDLFVNLNLANKSAGARIRYIVETEYRSCEITVVFVPTREIARTLYKYRNSILKFNPRSYLGLSKNRVNTAIAKTMREKSTNEFALFNNGITVLSDKTFFTEQTGKKDTAQLKLTNPQIINGGQTAYTLSQIYEEEISGKIQEDYFAEKEVLLKVITFLDEADSDGGKANKLELIRYNLQGMSKDNTFYVDTYVASNADVHFMDGLAGTELMARR